MCGPILRRSGGEKHECIAFDTKDHWHNIACYSCSICTFDCRNPVCAICLSCEGQFPWEAGSYSKYLRTWALGRHRNDPDGKWSKNLSSDMRNPQISAIR